MTSTADRAEINRRNAARSTGPRTHDGKQRSRFNALKHGLERHDPCPARRGPRGLPRPPRRLVRRPGARRRGRAVPGRAGGDGFVEDRAGRPDRGRPPGRRGPRRRCRPPGCPPRRGRPAGPAAARQRRPGRRPRPRPGGRPDPRPRAQGQACRRGPGAPRAARRPPGDDRRGMHLAARRWAELRASLEQGLDWDEDQFVQAVRLSGRQPLNLDPERWENHKDARYFVDVEEPEPGGDPELDEERQEALDAAIEAEIQAEDRRKLLLQLVDVPPADEAGERAALLGVVERASGRLTELAAAHQARWDAEAIERAEQMSFDTGPEEERQWRYQFGCGRSLRQTLDTLLKLRRGGKGQGPSAGGHDDHTRRAADRTRVSHDRRRARPRAAGRCGRSHRAGRRGAARSKRSHRAGRRGAACRRRSRHPGRPGDVRSKRTQHLGRRASRLARRSHRPGGRRRPTGAGRAGHRPDNVRPALLRQSRRGLRGTRGSSRP